MTRSARIRFSLGMTAAVVVAAAAAACSDGGRIGNAPVDEVAQPQCLSIEPGRAPIRRMTRAEYNNTVRDLLGDTTAPATAFVVEEEALGFNNQATSLGVTQLLAEQLMIAAEKLAAAAVTDVDKLTPYCVQRDLDDQACGKAFIERFGKRAYRRPLTADEATRLFDLYIWGLGEGGRAKGLSLVLQAMLQAPQFLYRVELGMPDPVVSDVVKLTPYEVASRLSYLLWNSMPDDDLFERAEEGTLGTAAEVEAEARRMLEDPRARQAVANFHTQWLKLSHIEDVSKSPTTYPAYSDALRPLWQEETQAFLEHVVFDGEGDVATILSAPYSMMNDELAAFYGLTPPGSGEAFVQVEIDPSERAGILTHASLLAVHAKPNQSSPVHRGKFVREMLLCQILPPPPNNIEIKPPEVKPGATTRERFSQHADDPTCASCHRLMDPIGFGFEHYDGIGQWRDMDQGLPVDASGEVTGAEEVDGKFNGAVELANKLAESELVRQCVATQWFRFGYGRAEQDDEDQCSMSEIQDAFSRSGGNIKELLIALTQTEAFRFRHRFK